MNNETSKFPFTSTGVHEWQTEVTKGGQASIDTECDAIADGFTPWFLSRFALRSDQIEFVEELDPLLTQSYGAALQYALQYGVKIQLEKEENTSKKELNPKVAIMEEKIERWRNGSKKAGTGDSLLFRIFYP